MRILMRVIGCLTVLIITFLVTRKIKKIKPHAWIISVCTTVAFLMLWSIFPLENHFLRFDSPEKAFKFANPLKKVSLVVDGEESSLVVSNQPKNVSLLEVYIRDGEKWRLGRNLLSREIMSAPEEYLIILYHCKNTRDYYVVVNSDVEIEQLTDNKNSTFDLLQWENGVVKNYTYYTHVVDYTDEYYLIINGQKFYYLRDMWD